VETFVNACKNQKNVKCNIEKPGAGAVQARVGSSPFVDDPVVCWLSFVVAWILDFADYWYIYIYIYILFFFVRGARRVAMRRRAELERAGPYAAEQLTAQAIMVREAAGRELRTIVSGLYVGEMLSPRKVCDIAHYHTASGGVGLKDLAMVPDPGNHNHNAHVRLCL
jgi:hypothetical protein